jgi:DNA polymerase
MGVPVWVTRDAGDALLLQLQNKDLPGPQAVSTVQNESRSVDENGNAPSDSSPMADMMRTLNQESHPPASTSIPARPATRAEKTIVTPGKPLDLSCTDWSDLEATVKTCRRCELCDARTRTVFGSGDQSAKLMIIGEAPGADEDRQGLPFVGRAGQLLTNMLSAIGFARDQVYIANMLKCRPPNNRDPRPEEVAQCRSYLERQIELINPDVILVVGRIAAQNLLQVDAPLGRLRNRRHSLPLDGTPVVVTYHPAYLLRQPREKGKTWEDLKLTLNVLENAKSH